MEQKGPEERKEIYQVLEPDDRQSGWRNRTYLAKYDLASGIMQQLTFGYRNIWASDISADGKKMLFMESHTRLEKRPTTLYSLYLMDMATMQVDTLVENDGFLNSARFSPCSSQIVISGSPEALDGIGKNVKEGQTPSMYDYQLYIMNLADKKITPVTKDFNPNVGSYVWNRYDGQIYFTAENTDLISLFKMDPVSGKIVQMPVGEDLVNRFTLATAAPVMVWYGQGASNSDRSYIVDLKKGKTTLLEDLSREILAGVKLGECHGWNFTNSKGDEINGRYYLPANFDPSKKYQLIVNYYGGCSPTERNFESRYPHHLYAAMGYVVYVVNPSGATGFGQEFSARHVNT
ncbi:MAG: S9 family peptidase, partial [Bacteroidales bacterium]|nr:S9 family peptidase [Bacteroidales bacterium]